MTNSPTQVEPCGHCGEQDCRGFCFRTQVEPEGLAERLTRAEVNAREARQLGDGDAIGLAITTLTALRTVNDELVEALEAAQEHLVYIGYGDAWERECAVSQKLPEKIATALAKIGDKPNT